MSKRSLVSRTSLGKLVHSAPNPATSSDSIPAACRRILAARSPSLLQMASSSKLDIRYTPLLKGTLRHLGAQTAGGRLVPLDAVCKDTSASAFLATQPLYKTCYRRLWRYARIGQICIAQKAFMAAMKASHMHDKFGRPAHDRH
jgi:hypothetical protein